MHRTRLVSGLAGAFALMAGIFAVGGVLATPVLFILAALFGAIAYLLYSHASGRLLGQLYRGVERRASAGSGRERGGFGAGPREEWTPPGGRQRRRARNRRARRGRGEQRSGPSAREAYRVLGVDPGAGDRAVKQAYRRRIKEVHPDAEDGDEEAFKRVQEAYETLVD